MSAIFKGKVIPFIWNNWFSNVVLHWVESPLCETILVEVNMTVIVIKLSEAGENGWWHQKNLINLHTIQVILSANLVTYPSWWSMIPMDVFIVNIYFHSGFIHVSCLGGRHCLRFVMPLLISVNVNWRGEKRHILIFSKLSCFKRVWSCVTRLLFHRNPSKILGISNIHKMSEYTKRISFFF